MLELGGVWYEILNVVYGLKTFPASELSGKPSLPMIVT